MHLVEVFLPLNDKASEHYPEVRKELTQLFGGLTAFTQAPAEGFWKGSGGDTERDTIVVVEVLTETVDRDWWHMYRRKLERRFNQDQILIRTTHCETL
jgi:hypothetical protein